MASGLSSLVGEAATAGITKGGATCNFDADRRRYGVRAQPISLRRAKRERPCMAARRSRWRAAPAILAAVMAASFVAGQVGRDASCLSNGAIAGTGSLSPFATKSRTSAITFPAANRSAKGDRFGASIADDEIGAAVNRGTKNGGRGPVRSRAIPVQHCEPVGSRLAGPAVMFMPSRSCLALLEPLLQYSVLGVVARPLRMNNGGA